MSCDDCRKNNYCTKDKKCKDKLSKKQQIFINNLITNKIIEKVIEQN